MNSFVTVSNDFTVCFDGFVVEDPYQKKFLLWTILLFQANMCFISLSYEISCFIAVLLLAQRTH